MKKITASFIKEIIVSEISARKGCYLTAEINNGLLNMTPDSFANYQCATLGNVTTVLKDGNILMKDARTFYATSDSAILNTSMEKRMHHLGKENFIFCIRK